MGPLEFYIIRQTLLTVERVDKLKNVEWYKPVYICAFAGYAKITSSAQKVYTDMLFLALSFGNTNMFLEYEHVFQIANIAHLMVPGIEHELAEGIRKRFWIPNMPPKYECASVM